jgi:hypothetical protein
VRLGDKIPTPASVIVVDEGPAGGAAGVIGPPGWPAAAMPPPHMLQKRASSAFFAPQRWQKDMARGVYTTSRGELGPLAPRRVWDRVPRVRAALLTMFVLGVAAHASAQGDGVYGRLDGDLALSAGVNGGIVLDDRVHPAVTGSTSLELRARILDSGGVFAAGEWRPEGDSRVVLGVDIRPLFLPRFLLGAQTGSQWLDLLVDSIGLDLGAAIGPFDVAAGVGLAIGFGLDVPLYLPERTSGGVFLRLGARYVTASRLDQAAPAGGTADWVLLAGLDVRALIASGLPRWEGARYRPPTP